MGSSSYLRSAAALVAVGFAFCGILVAPGTGHADPTADRQRQLASAWQELEGVIERFNAVRDDLRATDAQLERVNSRLVPLQTGVEAAQRATDEAAGALYRSGAVASTAVLISAPSPESFMDQLATLGHLSRRRSDALRRLKADRDALATERVELDGLKVRQQAQQQELGERRTTIEAQVKRLGVDRTDRTARAPSGALHDGYVPSVTGDPAGQAVKFAYSQLGKVYRWGSGGPDTFDCSGLTMAAWKSAGVDLPHNAARQKKTVIPIGRDDLAPGDLVFYYRDISHVGMYIGDGRVVEAPRAGAAHFDAVARLCADRRIWASGPLLVSTGPHCDRKNLINS